MAAFHINVTTGTGSPIYRQMVDQVRLAAATGVLPPGEAAPSVRSLAERLLVNANTVAIVFDINPQRLDFCKRAMGIADAVHVQGDGAELTRLQELTGGALAEVVIDATGSSQSMSNAFNYVAFGGRLVFLGITTDEIRFAQPLMHRREMTFLASRNALPEDFTRIIPLIEEGRIDTRPWISHRAGFDDMIGEFPRWLKPQTGVIKAMVAVD
jgi:alcohol dehydrogenase